MTILIADHEAAARATLKSALEGWDFEVAEAVDGDQALAALQAEDAPLVALVRWETPGLDGIEISRRLHAQVEGPHPHLILVTKGRDERELLEAVEHGVDDYLMEPWEPSALRARVSVGLRIVEFQTELAERTRSLEETLDSLRRSEERYALAAEAANDGLWEWQLDSNELYLSPRWKFLLGYDEAEIGTSPDEWLDRIHPGDRSKLEARLQAHLDGDAPSFEIEHRLKHKDGTYRWALARGLAVRGEEGKPIRVVGSQTDITDHRAATELSRHFASHDALTGLRNRSSFLDRVRYSLAQKRRRQSDYLFAVVCLNLDGFKAVNDTLGHDFGDLLLKEVAARLAHCVRMVDGLGRLGSDGFAVLVDDMEDVSDALRVAHRIQEDLGKPFDIEGQEIFVSASIGIALSSSNYERPEEFLRDADTALYRAKTRGRDNCEVFDPAIHAQTTGRLQLENDLRRAIEHEQFAVYFQPIVCLGTGKIAGFEALARWRHPTRGQVSPAEFIPVAEEIGVIAPIGRWVMQAACEQIAQWQRQFAEQRSLMANVNLSGKELADAELAQRIDGTLEATGLGAASLQVEVTETALMEDCEAAWARLQELKTRGIGLHIDDFGTGYSSLSYLHRFQMDTLKIDRSFISRALIDEESMTIVQTVVGLARDLGMGVIAEGVELPEQLDQLRELKCEYAQGYLFSMPQDREGAEALLKLDRQW